MVVNNPMKTPVFQARQQKSPKADVQTDVAAGRVAKDGREEPVHAQWGHEEIYETGAALSAGTRSSVQMPDRNTLEDIFFLENPDLRDRFNADAIGGKELTQEDIDYFLDKYDFENMDHRQWQEFLLDLADRDIISADDVVSTSFMLCKADPALTGYIVPADEDVNLEDLLDLFTDNYVGRWMSYAQREQEQFADGSAPNAQWQEHLLSHQRITSVVSVILTSLDNQ